MAYQVRGFESGILLANLDNGEEFLFNGCINYYFKFVNERKISFNYVCERTSWFKGDNVFYDGIYSFDKNRLGTEDIVSLIRNWLDNGIYVHGAFNEKYIPNKNAFGRKDFKHAYMIYGYNQEEQILYAVGYTNRGKYEKYTITYSDFLNAIYNLKDPSFFSLKYLNLNRRYEFDINMVHWELSDYLHSENTIRNALGKDPEDYYGVSANRAFRAYVLTGGKNNNYLDPRYSRLFFENKFFMRRRLGYMAQKGFVGDYEDAYASVASKSHRVHMLFLKYNVTGDNKILQSLDGLIDEINIEDERILNQVFDEITAFLIKRRKEKYL